MRLFWRIGVAALLTAAAPAQQPTSDEQSTPPRDVLPSGFRLIQLSAYAEGDFLKSSTSLIDFPALRQWLATGGVSSDAELRLGRLSVFTVNYHAGYSYNQRYSTLNGASHRVSVGIRTNPAGRTIFTLDATGETGLISDGLFDPSNTLLVAQQSRSLSDLSQGLGQNTTEGALNSAMELGLSGGRRRAAAVHLSIMRMHSRRFSTRAEIDGARELRVYRADQPAAGLYPNVTVGWGSLALSYQLAPRTRLTGTGTYTRSYARVYPAPAEFATADLGIERELGRRSFVGFRGGYVRALGPLAGGFGQSSYMVAGSYGTMVRRHTVGLTVRRGAGDTHGLNAQSTMAGDGAWSWTSRTNAWRLGGSISYERLNQSAIGSAHACMGQAIVARRISSTELSITAIYLENSFFGSNNLLRTGMRIAVAWAPERRH